MLDSHLIARHRQPDVHAASRGHVMIDARLKVLVAAGLILGATAIGITLTGAPITIARVNTERYALVEVIQQPTRVCQARETLPPRTSAIRLRTAAFLGPRVKVEARAHGRVIAEGERGSGWTGGVVTIPVSQTAAASSGVELCFTFQTGNEPVELVGELTTGALAARTQGGPLPGRVRVEYLRPDHSSWWSLAPEVARRMGLGRAASGTWSVLLVIALMGGLVVVCSRLILRELR